MDKPLPKTYIDAMCHYLETGSLDYLPDDSDIVLNVLTDGLGDLKEITLQIPDKCKYNLLHFDNAVAQLRKWAEKPAGGITPASGTANVVGLGLTTNISLSHRYFGVYCATCHQGVPLCLEIGPQGQEISWHSLG